MILKTAFVALFIFSPLLSANTVQADEYLIISNLPAGPGSKEARKLIEPIGEIKSIKCYDVKFTTGMKKSCNVLMWSTEKAQQVVKALNGNTFRGKKLYSKEIYPVPCPDVLA